MIKLVVRSLLLGIGLAMDAFSVSITNALREPEMKLARMSEIAGVYGFFQFTMPMLGWLGVTAADRVFGAFHRWVPWIALVLLLYLGGRMLADGIKGLKQRKEKSSKDGVSDGFVLTGRLLLLQGFATSVDALSTGFAIETYAFGSAFACSLIIGAVTYLVCMAGLTVGKRIGRLFTGYADIVGGLILIGIGVEVFISH